MAAKTGKARLFAVIGDPVAHSLSPLIHEYWISHFQLDAAYVALYVPDGTLDKALINLKTYGFKGLNITLPHKQHAWKLATTMEQTAHAVGAVNTLIYNEKEDIWHGLNTDIYGFEQLWNHHVTARQHKTSKITVLGAGGAARAVLYALSLQRGLELSMVNRTVEKAQILVEQLGLPVTCYTQQQAHITLREADIVINTLPTQPYLNDWLQECLTQTQHFCSFIDISYNHNGTETTRIGQQLVRHTDDGLLMLVHQAAAAFSVWWNRTPPVTPELIQTLKTALAA